MQEHSYIFNFWVELCIDRNFILCVCVSANIFRRCPLDARATFHCAVTFGFGDFAIGYKLFSFVERVAAATSACTYSENKTTAIEAFHRQCQFPRLSLLPEVDLSRNGNHKQCLFHSFRFGGPEREPSIKEPPNLLRGDLDL